MRDTLRKAKPQCLEDLIALNALYRPGPLRGGVVDDYIARKHRRVDIKYELPQMEPVLKETYGVIAYQEQVMRLASELAGFTLGQADELRRAMGKKDAAKMEAQRDRFLEGCRERDIPARKAKKIFEFIEFFAGYGFNKSHSTTYAVLAYQTAYLKANYPWHFMAALLTIESQNSDKIALYLAECRELGVPVLPPDVNRSELQFVVETGGVRFGLGAIKGAGAGAIESLVEARHLVGGRIGSLFRLAEHLDLRLVNKKVLECLVKAGAFDSLAPGGSETYLQWRPRLLAGLDRVLDHGNRHQRDRDQGQTQLFGGADDQQDELSDDAALTPARPWSEAEALLAEKEALGLYMSGHPLNRYAETLAAVGARRLADLTQSEANCALGGVATGIRQLRTRTGKPMAVFWLEDEAAKVETVVFPQTFTKCGGLIVDDAMLLVRGKYERDDESARLVAEEISLLDTIRNQTVREVEICLTGGDVGPEAMRRLAGVLERHPGDRRVSVVVEVNGKSRPMRVRTQTARKIRPTDDFVRDVEALCGAGSVRLR
jgi:DNA polymerase-3 subunit alpha